MTVPLLLLWALLGVGFLYVDPKARAARAAAYDEMDHVETLLRNNAPRSAANHWGNVDALMAEAKRWHRLSLAIYVVIIVCGILTLL